MEQVSREGNRSSVGRIPRLPPTRFEAGSSHKLQPKHWESKKVKIWIKQKSSCGIKVQTSDPILSGHSAVMKTERALDGLQRDYRLPEYGDEFHVDCKAT